MKVIVCIGNNLKYDTRVKRHIKSIARHGHQVHVIASPVPDSRYGLKETESMSHVFSEYRPQEPPINDEIMDFAKVFGLEEVFLNSFPILASSSYYNPPDLERYTKELYRRVRGGRWKDIVSRISEEMSDEIALSYPMRFFEKSVQFAKDVLKYEADVVLCNDEDTLLAGVVHKLKYKSRLIYDFHDLMADISDGVFPQMYSNVLTLFEKQMIQHADAVMSVSESELLWSKAHYDFQAPAVPILNCSAAEVSPQMRTSKRAQTERIRLYYHGMCDYSRGLFELLEAIKQFDQFVLVLRCLPSDILEEIRKKVSEERLEDKVIFLEPVSAEKIPEAANRDGDIGFAFCKTDKCLNWQFALQNKFIEYVKAGLPVITSATKEQAKIVKQYQIGWVLEENSVEGIIITLKRILKERDQILRMTKNSFCAADREFDWKIYDKVLNAVIVKDRSVIRKYAISFKRNRRILAEWNKEDLENGHVIKKKGFWENLEMMK